MKLKSPLSAVIFIMICSMNISAFASGNAINVVAGTYGRNCGAQHGNKTSHLAAQCNGKKDCSYRIDHTVIGDPAYGCGKEYIAEWRCGSGPVRSTKAKAEAGFGSVIRLDCSSGQGTHVSPPAPTPSAGNAINVVAGTYGRNCGAQHGNKTSHLAAQCNGKKDCSYRIDHTVIGDPAYGCGKEYIAEWRCGSGPVRSTKAKAEAGFGSVIRLDCSSGQGTHVSPPAPTPSAGNAINVVAGTYGRNCGAQHGNKTSHLAAQCNGKKDCSYRIDHTVIGDPAYGCGKEYIAEWRCGSGPVRSTKAKAEAGFGSVIRLDCSSGQGTHVSPPAPTPSAGNAINVVAGTYGRNCGAQHGNKTSHLAAQCNGKKDCSYRIDHTVIGDPAYGCGKEYIAEWRCGSGPIRSTKAKAEAGFGSVIKLMCR